MELNQVYFKTAKGQEEIQKRTHKLAPNLRRILIMVDGRTTATELIQRLTVLGDIDLALAQLEVDGFIAPRSRTVSPAEKIGTAAPVADEVSQPEFNLDRAKGFVHSTLLGAMGSAAGRRIERITAAVTPQQLRIEVEALRDLLPKALPKQRAEQVWQQLESVISPLQSGAPAPKTPSESAQPEFNLDKAKNFVRYILLGTMGPAAGRRIERIEAVATPEQLQIELNVIREMLPKVLSKRQSEQAWRQLEPIMASISLLL